jgi:hypothetical protein
METEQVIKTNKVYTIKPDPQTIHVVANVLFLYCVPCNANFQVAVSEIETTKCAYGTVITTNVFVCPFCGGQVEIMDRQYGHFDKLNDYYGTTVSC